MNEIIYYGVGKNLRDYEEDFVKETGLPVCLVDRNECLQNTEILLQGVRLSVVSLQYAREHYPEADYYVTLADHNIPAVYDYLLNFPSKHFQIKPV